MKRSLIFFTFLLASTSAFAQEQVIPLPELGYDFHMSWRLGASVFTYQEFPLPAPHQDHPLLYDRVMIPRGSLILERQGNLANTPVEQQRILRSKDVDITPLLTVVSAQHRNEKGEVKYYPSQNLPKIKVMYEPEMPDEIVLPSEVGTAVLLWQIGAGKDDEWAEGYWHVTLRLDARSLKVQLTPQGAGGIPASGKEGREGGVVLFPFDFNVKKIRTEDDRLNYFMFKYQDDKSKGDYAESLAALNAILKKYPNDGPTLFARSQLYADALKNFPAAVTDVQQLLKFAEENHLRRWFRPLTIDSRSTPEEAIEWLKKHIQFLEYRAAQATLPAPAKPQ